MAALDAVAPASTTPEAETTSRRVRSVPVKRNRGALPAELPRVEQVIDVEDKVCPCCGGALRLIGEDRTKMLDFVPAHFRVRVTRRPQYGCRACEDAVVQAPAPERPIDGGMATEALPARVLVNKYSDHLPRNGSGSTTLRGAFGLVPDVVGDGRGRHGEARLADEGCSYD